MPALLKMYVHTSRSAQTGNVLTWISCGWFTLLRACFLWRCHSGSFNYRSLNWKLPFQLGWTYELMWKLPLLINIHVASNKSHPWEDWEILKASELKIDTCFKEDQNKKIMLLLWKICAFKSFYSFFYFVTTAQRRGPRGERHDLWQHVGPPGNLLLRMPAQLHPLSASVWAYAWLLALALQLQRVPGSLPSHHALSLVGGTHTGCCVAR